MKLFNVWRSLIRRIGRAVFLAKADEGFFDARGIQRQIFLRAPRPELVCKLAQIRQVPALNSLDVLFRQIAPMGHLLTMFQAAMRWKRYIILGFSRRILVWFCVVYNVILKPR